MSIRRLHLLATVGCLGVLILRPLHAQSADAGDDRLAGVIAGWIGLSAPAGAEAEYSGLATSLTGWTVDPNGNFVRRIGQGSPRRVVACGLDAPGWVVSQITDDGYIRLHRAGGAPAHPLADQFLEAHKVLIHTARGQQLGVVAIPNGHFVRQHRGDTTVVTVDQLWVDIGVSSRAEAEKLGVALLDPVTAEHPQWTYAGMAAGPAAGARAGCAAVATAARGTVPAGETVFILSAQHTFNWAGLNAALARLGRYDEVTIVGEARRGAAAQQWKAIVPRVRFGGSPVESISAAEARDLLAKVAVAASVALPTDVAWTPGGHIDPPPPRTRTDGYEVAERLVTQLLDIPGVYPHEWRVRDAVRAALPQWARDKAVVDSAGNLIVAAGPDHDTVAFVAHTDEVGFAVERILGDGTVTLTRVGGAVASAWEGQEAVLYFDRNPGDVAGVVAEPMRGVFVPRDTARVKAPSRTTAWFGLDSAALVARGVRPGAAVIGWKRAEALAGTRITGRSSDDRTGSTALILAARRINPAMLRHKVLLIWSTGEEAGLLGARAFGARYGPALTRVYAVDTFVTSDTPLESRLFAYAPLGQGAVVRALDASTVVPRAERDRVVRVARAAQVPLQIGTTEGSTDGSAIGAFGPPNIGLSWPGRYSHTPGEVLDLRDLDALSRLVAALAVAP